MNNLQTDVLIIGAGPAGAIAAAILLKNGHRVIIVEKASFPRFVIGESLLPYCMNLLENAGLLEAVKAHGFQKKRGADFHFRGQKSTVEFGEQFSNGWHYTFQVKRSEFDNLLAKKVIESGAMILFQHEVLSANPQTENCSVIVSNLQNEMITINSRFILDASGNAAVLGNLLKLNEPSILTPKSAIYSHQKIDFNDTHLNREKISVVIHPTQPQCWYWIIPFQDNSLSVGFTTTDDHIAKHTGNDSQKLFSILNEVPEISSWVKEKNFLFPAVKSSGYSRRIKSFFGNGFAIAGNAGEFLDPVFSSGVTIALKSGSDSANLIHSQLSGNAVNWQLEYVDPLLKGIRVFEAFVQAWYNEDLIKIFFNPTQQSALRIRISSILAGYAWDETNSLTQHTNRRIKALAEACSQ
jgi:flavin-dependent dehydrogenase